MAAGGAIGWVACAYGLAGEPRNFLGSYLVSYVFFLSIGWGAMFFVMVQHLASATWSVTVRRLMETIMITVPAMTLLFVPVAAGIPTLYEWSHPGYFDRHNPNLSFKAVFFSQPFHMARAVFYFVVWAILAVVLYRNSVAQDNGANLKAYSKTRWWSGPGLVVLCVTASLASVDWVMSLEPHWYSTIFGIYVLSGGGLAFIALLILVCLALRRAEMLRKSITVEHYHDLGSWLFALTVWWAYIAFSQYMLIWYADIPQETSFFKHRFEGTWLYVSALLLFGHFALPFVVLMPRAAKRNLKVLGFAAAWILLMHGMDLHWLILPAVRPHRFQIQWLDAATFLAVGSFFALVFWYRLRKHPMVPVGDPRLVQALAHHST